MASPLRRDSETNDDQHDDAAPLRMIMLARSHYSPAPASSSGREPREGACVRSGTQRIAGYQSGCWPIDTISAGRNWLAQRSAIVPSLGTPGSWSRRGARTNPVGSPSDLRARLLRPRPRRGPTSHRRTPGPLLPLLAKARSLRLTVVPRREANRQATRTTPGPRTHPRRIRRGPAPPPRHPVTSAALLSAGMRDPAARTGTARARGSRDSGRAG